MLRHPDFLQIAHQSDAEQMSQRSVSKQRLIVFYERKTQQILERYGPGPRVHYHTGLADEPPCPRASREELRAELIAAQERTLQHAAAIWNAHAWLSGD